MVHLPETNLHCHASDPLLVLVHVDGLTSAQVTDASWRVDGATPVDKALGTGIAVISGSTAKFTYPDEDWTGVADTDAVLVVDVDPADTVAAGVGRWYWQARAGGAEPKVVARGRLTVTATVPGV